MSNFLNLQAEPLDLNTINELITHPSCGAVSFFCGTTRDNFEDKQVASLEYEAYTSMALKSMKQICDELRTKWPDIKHVAIYHRLGVVPVREASVIIGVSSPHRLTSLEAVQIAIDRLKQIVPIWKKERYHQPAAAAIHHAAAPTPQTNPASAALLLPPRNPRKTSSARIDFTKCPVPVKISTFVPAHLVQIRATEAELRRRVDCFVDMKRDEINAHNVQDFIEPPPVGQREANDDGDETMTCARVCSSVYRSTNASSHLRIHRVKNEHGPQLRRNYTDALDKLMLTNATAQSKADSKTTGAVVPLNEAVHERLHDAETALGLKPIPGSIYARLKAIEQRLAYLETVSPEYCHFVQSSGNNGPSITHDYKPAAAAAPPKKTTYTAADVDTFIQQFQHASPCS